LKSEDKIGVRSCLTPIFAELPHSRSVCPEKLCAEDLDSRVE
jgi:hypothetical protein